MKPLNWHLSQTRWYAQQLSTKGALLRKAQDQGVLPSNDTQCRYWFDSRQWYREQRDWHRGRALEVGKAALYRKVFKAAYA